MYAVNAYTRLERATKEFVGETLRESLHLENLLRSATTEHFVVVLHYAPIPETLFGVPVFNVSEVMMRRRDPEQPFMLYELEL